MASLRNLVVTILRLAGATSIAAALRYHAQPAPTGDHEVPTDFAETLEEYPRDWQRVEYRAGICSVYTVLLVAIWQSSGSLSWASRAAICTPAQASARP